MTNIVEAANRMTDREEAVRQILLDEFNTFHVTNADYHAVSELAVDCGLKLLNVLLSARKPNGGGTHKALMDLTVGLGGNSFWRQNSSILLPLLHSALQAQLDYALLRQEAAANPNSTAFTGLISECELVGLEIFPAIGYLLAGYEQMAVKSLTLKKRLMPYLQG